MTATITEHTPVSEIPVGLKVSVLRALAHSKHPRHDIGTIASNRQLSIATVKAIADPAGYPDQARMLAKADELERQAAAGAEFSSPSTPPKTPAAAPERRAATAEPARAETTTTKPADRTAPYVAALACSELFADPTYQRPLNELRVQRMPECCPHKDHGSCDLGCLGQPLCPRATAIDINDRLRRYAFRYANEAQLQEGVHDALLAQLTWTVRREVRLDDASRIDFLVDTVGVEVKVNGETEPLQRQLTRYAAHDQVAELLVVTNRRKHQQLPASIDSKPVHVLVVGGL